MELENSPPFNFDVIILELGTGPTRDIGPFCKYLRPDIAWVPAGRPSTWSFFRSIDKVAKETRGWPLRQLALINRDDIDATLPDSSTTAASTPTAPAAWRISLRSRGFRGRQGFRQAYIA